MADTMLSPLTWLVLALLCAALMRLARWRARWPMATAVVVVVVALGMMTPLAANSFVGSLELAQPAPESCVSKPPSAIVVLAAGLERQPRDAADFAVLDRASRIRADAAIAHWHSLPDRTLVFSGGPGRGSTVARADLLAAYARWHGVNPDAIRIEPESRTTLQNAAGLAAMELTKKITLVTSAMHMPRARASLQAAGFEVCASPADFRRVSHSMPWSLVPRSSALVMTEDALHELAGLAWYRWRLRDPETHRR